MEVHEIFHNVPFVLLYGGVSMLSIIAALYLLLRRGNAIAPDVTSPVRLRRWAAAFLLVSALSHVFWLIYAYYLTPPVYVIVCGLDLLLMTPTITGFLLSMLQDRERNVWPVMLGLIPAFILMSLCLIRGDESLYPLVTAYAITLYALLMLYMYFAVRRYGRWLRDNYADLEHKEVWQSFLILAGVLLFFIAYGTAEESHLLLYLFQIDCVILSVLLLWRVETLQELTESNPPEEDAADEAQKAASAPSIPSSIGPLLKKHCEDGQLYLQNGLTLAQLAQIIGTNRYYLSQYFAQQGLTYNAYINGLRVRHFVRLYHEAVARQQIVTAQQLAFDSGFHSYSTFSSTFKQNMGMPVSKWMRDNEK